MTQNQGVINLIYESPSNSRLHWSHTAVSLIKGGHDVVIIDNFSNSSPSVGLGLDIPTGRNVIQLMTVQICLGLA